MASVIFSLLHHLAYRTNFTTVRHAAITYTTTFAAAAAVAATLPLPCCRIEELVNLIASDATRLMQCIPWLHFLPTGMVQVSVAVGLLWGLLGPAIIVGVVCTLVSAAHARSTIARGRVEQ